MRLRVPLALLLFLPASAFAQVRTAGQQNLWFGLLGDYPVGRRLAIAQELWLRRADAGATWQQDELLHGVSWTLDPHWRVAAGHTYVHSYSYGELPRPAADENRAWAQLSLAHGLGPLRLSHRARGEWRWISANGAHTETAHWRQQLRATYPLTPKAYLFGTGESFIRVHPAAERYALEQVRLSTGAGFTVAKATVVEVGWLEERQRRAREREHNHTLVLALRAGWRLR